MNTLELGSRFRTITSSVPTIPFDSGNVRSVELPRSFLYRNIAMRASLSFNVSAIATLAEPVIDQPLPILSKIELVADGRKILWTGSARDLWKLCWLFYGKQPELIPPTVAIANPVLASFTIIIPNAALRMMLSADSLFDPREYEKIEFRVSWATTAAIFATGTVAVNTTTQLDIQVQQTTEGVEHSAFNRVIQFDEQVPTSTQSNFQFNVPRAGLLAGFIVRTDDTNGKPVDNVINFLTLKSDNSFNHVDRAAWLTLKNRNVPEYQLDNIEQRGAVIAAGSNNFAPVGWAYVDLTEDGLMTSTLNTLALNVLQIILDITITTKATIRVTYVFYEPIRPLTG